MSGGRFDYIQYRFPEIIESIENELLDDTYKFNEDTIKELQYAIELLKKSQIYITKIDYLLEGDISEKNFHEQLKKDLNIYVR